MHALAAESGLGKTGLLGVPTSVGAITPLVGRILIELVESSEKGEVVEVHLFHNQPKPGAAYDPVAFRLLPLDRIWRDRLAALPWPTKSLPEVIGDPARALRAFVSGYLFVQLFQACAESLASENASRLAAMQRAEKNIGDILTELSRRFHRIRQESIDEELFDVISGYEALTGNARPRAPSGRQ
jgi:F-type H+-transporting ATPase subunit gamma